MVSKKRIIKAREEAIERVNKRVSKRFQRKRKPSVSKTKQDTSKKEREELKSKVKSVIDSIQAGKITSIQQVPPELRRFIPSEIISEKKFVAGRAGQRVTLTPSQEARARRAVSETFRVGSDQVWKIGDPEVKARARYLLDEARREQVISYRGAKAAAYERATQKAYKDIETGELISAKQSPGEGFQEVRVSKETGEVVPEIRDISPSGKIEFGPTRSEERYQDIFTGKITSTPTSTTRKVEVVGGEIQRTRSGPDIENLRDFIPEENKIVTRRVGTERIQGEKVQIVESRVEDPTKGLFQEGRFRQPTQQEIAMPSQVGLPQKRSAYQMISDFVYEETNLGNLIQGFPIAEEQASSSLTKGERGYRINARINQLKFLRSAGAISEEEYGQRLKRLKSLSIGELRESRSVSERVFEFSIGPVSTFLTPETPFTKSVRKKPISSVALLAASFKVSPIETAVNIGFGMADLSEFSKRGEELRKGGSFLLKTDIDIPLIDEKRLGRIAIAGGIGLQTIKGLQPRGAGEVFVESLIERAAISKFIPKPVKTSGLGVLGIQQIKAGVTQDFEKDEQKFATLFGGGLSLVASAPGAINIGRGIVSRFQEGFSPSKRSTLGITTFAISDPETGRAIDVEIIPKRDVDVSGEFSFIEARSQLGRTKKPKLPRTTQIQKKFLEVVKEEGGIVSGSFAQQTFIKGAREFKDIDVLVRDPGKFADIVSKRLGDKLEIKEARVGPKGQEFDIFRVTERKTGKEFADIDPLRMGEEGFAPLSSPIKVKGLKLLPVDVRLAAKAKQSLRPLEGPKRKKVALDIAQLTGRPELQRSPTLLRGYGLTKEQQLKLYGGKELIMTHAGMNVIPISENQIKLKRELSEAGLLFYTPTLAKEGVAGARASRALLGIQGEKQVPFFESLVSGSKPQFNLFKRSQIIIEKGKIGKDIIQPYKGTEEIEVARVIEKEGTTLNILKRTKTVIGGIFGEPVEVAFVKKAKQPSTTQKPISVESLTRPVSRREKIVTQTPLDIGAESFKNLVKEDSLPRPSRQIKRPPVRFSSFIREYPTIGRLSTPIPRSPSIKRERKLRESITSPSLIKRESKILSQRRTPIRRELQPRRLISPIIRPPTFETPLRKPKRKTNRAKRIRTKTRANIKEPLILTTGFTARQLGLTKEIKKKGLEGEAKEISRAIGVRRLLKIK